DYYCQLYDSNALF
nr:immunoglobulin light chain junction region [Macaca mulatta]